MHAYWYVNHSQSWFFILKSMWLWKTCSTYIAHRKKLQFIDRSVSYQLNEFIFRKKLYNAKQYCPPPIWFIVKHKFAPFFCDMPGDFFGN